MIILTAQQSAATINLSTKLHPRHSKRSRTRRRKDKQNMHKNIIIVKSATRHAMMMLCHTHSSHLPAKTPTREYDVDVMWRTDVVTIVMSRLGWYYGRTSRPLYIRSFRLLPCKKNMAEFRRHLPCSSAGAGSYL